MDYYSFSFQRRNKGTKHLPQVLLSLLQTNPLLQWSFIWHSEMKFVLNFIQNKLTDKKIFIVQKYFYIIIIPTQSPLLKHKGFKESLQSALSVQPTKYWHSMWKLEKWDKTFLLTSKQGKRHYQITFIFDPAMTVSSKSLVINFTIISTSLQPFNIARWIWRCQQGIFRLES